MLRLTNSSMGLNHSSESVRIAALCCAGSVLGSLSSKLVADEVAQFLSPGDKPQLESAESTQDISESNLDKGCLVRHISRLANSGSQAEQIAALETFGRMGRPEVFPHIADLWPQVILPIFVTAIRSHNSLIRYHTLLALSALTKPASKVEKLH